MEWLSFSTEVSLILSCLIATSSGDFSSGAFQAVRCMLLQTAPSKCSSVTEVQIPSYLIKAYNDSPSSLHEALRSGQLVQLTEEQMASLPLTLLYLIPRGRLSDLSGAQLAAILQKHTADTSLAHQLTASVQHEKQLVELLKLSMVSQDVLHVLGESINKADLNHSLDSLPLQESLLAYLRPNVMLDLNHEAGYNVLLHLQGIQSLKLPKKETIYTIVQMAIKNHFPFSKIKWLVSGLSPDDLRNDTLQIYLNYHHFKLDLTIAQARAVFDQIYKNVNLTQSDLIDCLPVLPKLTPSMLQRLPARENYDSLLKLSVPQSLATACQIQEYVKANCNLTGKLPKMENEEWGFRIHYLGQWVFTLPLTALEEYLMAPLNTANLLEIESSALSALQTYYLTGKGQAFDLSAHNSVKVPESLLQALPTSQILSHSLGNITSTVVEHLASSLPADNLPRTLAFVSKIASVLSESPILENLLDNSDVNTMISLVSPKDLKVAAPKMLKWFKDKHEFAPIIRQLPQQILAALLEHVQQSENWSWENLLDKSHVSNLLVGGVTCQHIEQMESGLFIPVIAEYNRHRKQAFPRNLQICSLKKLISYLKFKMFISQTDPSLGLISMLEPIEIESVGGYILAGLPVEALRVSPYLRQILATIGKLSNSELILATNMTQLCSIAMLALDKEGSADVHVAGNLVWYLPPYTTLIHFKLMLQSGLLDTTLCLPQHLRESLAFSLRAEFGSPEVWSAGILATLQDLLLVFTEEELSKVSRATWTDAADTLTSHYGDNINWIRPVPFHQVCTSFLEESEEIEFKSAVRRLVRWRLQAAQWLLDTVKPSPHAKTTVTIIDFNDVDESEKTPIGAFDPPLTEDLTEVLKSTSVTYTLDQSSTSTTESSTTETTIELETSTTQSSSTTVTRRIPKEEVSTDKNINAIDSEIVNTPTSSTQLMKSTTNKITSEENVSKSSFNTSFYSQNTPKIEHTKENSFDQNNSYIPEEHSSNKISKASTSNENNNLISTTLPSSILSPTITNTSIKNMQTNPANNSSYNKIPNSSEANSDENSVKYMKISKSEKEKDSHTSDLNSNPVHSNEITIDTKMNETAIDTNKISDDSHKINDNSDLIEEDLPKAKSFSSIIIKNDTSSDSKVRRRRNIFQSDSAIQLSCNALRMVGRLSGIALTEEDLKSMSNSEIEECRVEFGAMDLSLQIRKHIWKCISRSTKMDGTHLLGGLLQAATVGDIWDFETWSVSHPWVLETIHAININANDHTVLRKVFKEIDESNSPITPELVAALGGSLCFLDWDTNSLQLPVVGLQPPASCRPCLPLLARKAVELLGPVTEWTQHYIHSLNDIVAGLELKDWKELTESSFKPLFALQPSAISCLNNSHLEILTTDHISMIPTLTLHALLPQQIAALNETQVQALRMATQVSVEDKLTPTRTIGVEEAPSSGSYLMASSLILLASFLHF